MTDELVVKGPMWIHFGLICGKTKRSDVVHAIDTMGSGSLPRGSKRRTRDGVCGVKHLRMIGAPTADGGTISLTFPPFVEAARSLGFERCRRCHELTGKRAPVAAMGSKEWFAKTGKDIPGITRIA